MEKGPAMPAHITTPTRHHLRRVVGAVIAVAAAVLATGGAASARSANWILWQPPTDVTVSCGNTPVHLTWPNNKEFVRELPLQPGTTDIQQFTGTLYVRFTTDAGVSILVNAGGPGLAITYTNGDVETRSYGHYVFAVAPEQAAALGVPPVFSTTGLIDFIYHPADNTMTPIKIPHDVIDVCAAMGL